MMSSTHYPLIDFDAHDYKPDDGCIRHIESKCVSQTVHSDRSDTDSLGRMMLANERPRFNSVIQYA